MPREMKFRAWDASGKVMVYFDFQHLVRAAMNDGRMDDGCRVQDLLDPSVPKMQYIGIHDRNNKEVFDDDTVRVYDMNRWCECNDWSECEDGCTEHQTHKHENPEDCDNYLCTQKVGFDSGAGYFCSEDNGEYRPALSAYEIELEVIGNLYENPKPLANPN